MTIAVNSIWKISKIDGVKNGTYRVLKLLPNINKAILFELTNDTGIKRPISCKLDALNESIDRKKTKQTSYKLPDYILITDEELPEKCKSAREKRYSTIKDLVDDETFLFDISKKQRIKSISLQAKKFNITIQAVYRFLNLYWKYGQDISSLTPATKNKGGKGVSKSTGSKKRGVTVTSRTGTVELNPGINITEDHQKIIEKGLNKFYLTTEKNSLSKAYEDTVKEFYKKEIEEAEIENTFPKIPTYNQFRYWKSKLIDPEILIKKRSTKGDYDRNMRGLLGSASEDSKIPGGCFEMDATVADIHIVLPGNRNHCLGRPTIYLVIDKASRMIVGLHVSMEYASWEAGRQALVNSFTSKKKFCKRFDVNITDSQWPCHHIPRRLLCDRGEMVCSNPESLVVPLTQLEIASPYRADMKGVVERCFKILNDDLLHNLIGTTKGRHYVRGETDPRARARYTIKEVTKLLIKSILKHNRSLLDSLAFSSPLLHENDLPYNPINFWNIHLLKHRHSLRSVDETEVRAKLSPRVDVSMTGYGIFYNDAYYSCPEIEERQWHTIARNDGHWKMEARADADNSSFIYVKLSDKDGFKKCQILQKSKMLKDLPKAEVLYYQDWKQQKAQKNKFSVQDICDYEERKDMDKNAKNEQKASPKNSTKSEKTADMRSRRNEAMRREKEERSRHIDELHGDVLSVSYEPKDTLSIETDKKLSFLSRKRRGK